MTRTRIPIWWVAVGFDRAKKLEELFHQVMAELPMSQRQLAERLEADPDPSTVTRWAKGETTPSAETMLEAVSEVRAYLEPLLERASLAEEAFGHVLAAAEARREKGMGAAQDEVEALEELLEELDEEAEE